MWLIGGVGVSRGELFNFSVPSPHPLIGENQEDRITIRTVS